jgi:hypothetical protein
MGTLASFFLSWFTSPVLSFVSKVIGNLTNDHAVIVQAQAGLDAAEANAVVNAEIARVNAQSALSMAMLTHPIWWIGWCLFVFPAGLYVGLINFKSFACALSLFEACRWNILEVPKQIEAWDQLVVMSFFGLAATSGVILSIANRIGSTPK